MKKRSMKFISVLAAGVMAVSIFALAGCSSGSQSSSSSAVSSAASSTSANSSAGTAGSQTSSAAAAAGDITVTVSMKESVAKATDADSPLQFAEEQINVAAPSGSSALEFLKGTDREVQTEGTGDNLEVTSIGSLANGDAGEGSHWVFELNGTIQRMSPTVCFPEDGDTLTWNFIKE